MQPGKEDCMCSASQKPEILFHNNGVSWLAGADRKQIGSSGQDTAPGCGEVRLQSLLVLSNQLHEGFHNLGPCFNHQYIL